MPGVGEGMHSEVWLFGGEGAFLHIGTDLGPGP